MIERVARVLSPQSWEALNTPCDTKAKKKRRESSLDYARRCVQAMREPTQEMLNIGVQAELYGVKYTWQVMIDEALEE